jgi:hypothetical protein
MLIINKPYLWLDTSGQGLLLKIKIWCAAGYGLLSTVPVQETDGDTLRLVYTVKAGGTGGTNIPDFDLLDIAVSNFDPAVHSRVSVIIIESADRILGLGTVKPGRGTYQVAGTGPDIYPYLYIQFRDTDLSIVHVASWVESKSNVAEMPPPTDNYNLFERDVMYEVGPTNNAFDFEHSDFLLDTTKGFDPVLDTIVVSIVDNSGGIERRKGTGTVHTSEADASSAG